MKLSYTEKNAKEIQLAKANPIIIRVGKCFVNAIQIFGDTYSANKAFDHFVTLTKSKQIVIYFVLADKIFKCMIL